MGAAGVAGGAAEESVVQAIGEGVKAAEAEKAEATIVVNNLIGVVFGGNSGGMQRGDGAW